MSKELLQVKDLVIQYKTANGIVHAVNGVTFSLDKGETLGLVGETGAGKTTTALGIIQLIPDPPGELVSGEIYFQGQDVLKMGKKAIRSYRGKSVAMIFQDPMTALNPVETVGEQILEAIKIHNSDISHGEAVKKAQGMLELVGIPATRFNDYPLQFSGGMRQRVVIAIALCCDPSLLIADEPTTALDVTIQAQVLELIKELKEKLGMSMLLITHDLGVVAETCDRVAIMYAGEIIEWGDRESMFNQYVHPYTKGLFGSIPRLDIDTERLTPIEGLMPDSSNLPQGCNFCERCKEAIPICSQRKPDSYCIGENHYVRCHLFGGEGRAE